jgi:hypothetical protein
MLTVNFGVEGGTLEGRGTINACSRSEQLKTYDDALFAKHIHDGFVYYKRNRRTRYHPYGVWNTTLEEAR